MRFVKLTAFRDAASTQPVEAWVNPERIAFFKSVRLGRANTRIFFAEDGTLEVAETPGEVMVAFAWCGLELTGEMADCHFGPQRPKVVRES